MISIKARPLSENCGGAGGLSGTLQVKQESKRVEESSAHAPAFVTGGTIGGVGCGVGVGGTTTTGGCGAGGGVITGGGVTTTGGVGVGGTTTGGVGVGGTTTTGGSGAGGGVTTTGGSGLGTGSTGIGVGVIGVTGVLKSTCVFAMLLNLVLSQAAVLNKKSTLTAESVFDVIRVIFIFDLRQTGTVVGLAWYRRVSSLT
ncbi:MAG: hypothetical protein H7256_04805 [Bdellovibrio sp.]|nr:hypothetical protein [Bdellovibrio sp.]